MDHHLETERTSLLKTLEPYEVFFLLQKDLKQLEKTLNKIALIKKDENKKTLFTLLIERDEWSNKFERLLSQFQQTWSISPKQLQKHLNSIHLMKKTLQEIKKNSNLQKVNDLKKELSLFQSFFTISTNENTQNKKGVNQSSSFCSH